MKIGKLISLISSIFIVFLMFYIFFTQDGGYMPAKEVEDSLKKEQTIVADVPQKSAEELQLEEMKRNLGDISYQKTSRLYASVCSACHGKNGEGSFNEKGEIVMPTIKGKNEEYILKRLEDYKNNRVSNPLMIGLLKNIKEDDLKALAKEISEFK
jgi:cytochrome c553